MPMKLMKACVFAGRFTPSDVREQAIELDYLKAIEPTPWLDPATGRTEIGSVAFLTHDAALAARSPVGKSGRLRVRWGLADDDPWDDLGPMRVAYNYPTVVLMEVVTYRIVFEPAGRR